MQAGCKYVNLREIDHHIINAILLINSGRWLLAIPEIYIILDQFTGRAQQLLCLQFRVWNGWGNVRMDGGRWGIDREDGQ